MASPDKAAAAAPPAHGIRFESPFGDDSEDTVPVPMSTRATGANGLPANFRAQRRGSVSSESYTPRRDSLLCGASASGAGANITNTTNTTTTTTTTNTTNTTNTNTLTPERRACIETALDTNLLFRNLDAEQRALILAGMTERSVPAAGVAVITQGEPGDNFYMVEAGRFAVEVDGREVVEIGPGGSFGELALMYNTPRAATVRSLVPGGRLLQVDRATFRRVIIDVAYRKRLLHMDRLRAMPLLATLSDAEVGRVADALQPCLFPPGTDVVRQGEPGATFYIIADGHAAVSRDGAHVARLGPGDFFGELALLNRRPRAATVTALEPLHCLSLGEADFVRLLGPLKDILKRSQDQYLKYQPFME